MLQLLHEVHRLFGQVMDRNLQGNLTNFFERPLAVDTDGQDILLFKLDERYTGNENYKNMYCYDNSTVIHIIERSFFFIF